ncbi:hypothetical protein Vadar_023338 [Vaccinium darrowii]|uniref:Uncharacterized protein n=1 Tax=Vaccinium darrowii TaxID=229202 RepID=A0ACB7YFR0_9ERIC|nr:hypothetical protein Vadar_023338 [Vaccinium darrowii]
MGDDNASSNSKLKEGLDPSSRYYFHHSDNAATKLFSQLLDGENWATWSRSIEIALSVKNKLGFVTGKFKKPSKSENPDEFDSWFSHLVSLDLVPSPFRSSAAPVTSADGSTQSLSGLSTEQYQQLTTAMANVSHLSKGNNDVYANVAAIMKANIGLIVKINPPVGVRRSWRDVLVSPAPVVLEWLSTLTLGNRGMNTSFMKHEVLVYWKAPKQRLSAILPQTLAKDSISPLQKAEGLKEVAEDLFKAAKQYM